MYYRGIWLHIVKKYKYACTVLYNVIHAYRYLVIFSKCANSASPGIPTLFISFCCLVSCFAPERYWRSTCTCDQLRPAARLNATPMDSTHQLQRFTAEYTEVGENKKNLMLIAGATGLELNDFC